MTDTSPNFPARFEALREVIRRLTPFVYIQTPEPHEWMQHLKQIGQTVRQRWTFVARTPDAQSEIQELGRYLEPSIVEAALRKLNVSGEPPVSGDIALITLVYARLTEQVIHDLKITALNKAASNDKWIPVVVVINDEPIHAVSFPEFVVIRDQGPTDEERNHYLTRVLEMMGHTDRIEPSLKDLVDLTRGMAFFQIERLMASVIVLNRKAYPDRREDRIPAEIFHLAAVQITEPAYSNG